MEDGAENALARMARTYRKMGERPVMQEGEIGRAVVSILRRQESVTAPDLIEHFRKKIAHSRSARGEARAELDVQRILCEEIIKTLSALAADGDARPSRE